MRKSNEYRASLVLAAGLAGSSLLSGAVAGAQVYESGPQDHLWYEHEDASFQRYLLEQQLDYRPYQSLNPDQQRRYREWRGAHPG